MFNKIKNNKGFTLIELIVVIGILSVITVVLITVFNPVEQLSKGRDVKRKSDLGQIQKALEQYYQDNGKYPSSDSSYEIVGANGTPVAWGASWSPYMNILPADPTRKYVYFSPDLQSYYLYASLERGSRDSQACISNDSSGACPSLLSNHISNDQCAGICNFGITSPNVSP